MECIRARESEAQNVFYMILRGSVRFKDACICDVLNYISISRQRCAI